MTSRIFLLGLVFVLTGCGNQNTSVRVAEESSNAIIIEEDTAPTELHDYNLEIKWPDVSDSLRFISENNFKSTYNGLVESVLYEYNIKLLDDSLLFSFVDNGIYNNTMDNLYYSISVSNNEINKTVKSNELYLLNEYLSLNENTVYSLLEMKQSYVNKSESEDKNTIQSLSCEDGLNYIVKESNIYLKEKVTGSEVLAKNLQSGEIFEPVESYSRLTEVEKSYLKSLSERLDSKSDVNIEIHTLPLSVLTEEKDIERGYGVYSLSIKEKMSSDLDVNLHLDGIDYYNMKRDWFFSVDSHIGKEGLRNSEVANTLGLSMDELNTLLDTEEPLYLTSDMYFTINKSESDKDFVSVIKVRQR